VRVTDLYPNGNFAQVRPPARSSDPVSSPVKKYPFIGVTFKIGGTKPTFVPPILNVTPCIGVTFKIGGTKPTLFVYYESMKRKLI
jgi:hypothetical protein